MKGNAVRICVGAVVVACAFGVAAVAYFCRSPALQDGDDLRATRLVVSWVVEGSPIPGFGEDYPDARIMATTPRFIVECDYLPEGDSLSTDPKVTRMPSSESKERFKAEGFDGTAYLKITRLRRRSNRLELELVNTFGKLGAHCYRFTFLRTAGGLEATGQLVWSS